jgi:hypothetical protein
MSFVIRLFDEPRRGTNAWSELATENWRESCKAQDEETRAELVPRDVDA